MRIKHDPETFHKWVDAILGHPISKDDAYRLWLTFGIEPKRGRTAKVPLGLISRIDEQVVALLDSEWPAEIADRLAEAGFHLNRRDIMDRIAKCSGFEPPEVVYWADRKSALVCTGRDVVTRLPPGEPVPPVSGYWHTGF